MFKEICCIDASCKQLAEASNYILRRSKNFAKQAYCKNILSSQSPKFTQESVKKFFNIGDFYQKDGKIRQEAKTVFADYLQEFGLKRNATLSDFVNYLLAVYK